MFHFDFKLGESPQPPSPSLPNNLWRVKHDIERPEGLWRKWVPEVYVLGPVHKVYMTKDWQERVMWPLFLYGAPNLGTGEYARKKFTETYGCHRAFDNNHGWQCKKTPPHGPFRNYITGEDLGKGLPAFDKPRVCGGATIAGEVNGDWLIVETLNKPVDIDWLVARPWLYFHATTVHADGTVGRFPQGDGSPVLIPLVAEIPVRYRLEYLQKVDRIADPYTIYL